MSGTHAGPVHPEVPGECGWRWHSDGVDLYCDDRAIPGGVECADHLIARLHPAAVAVQPEPAPGPWRRWFTEEPT